MNNKIYHYTTIELLNKIIDDGVIKLATAGLDKKEKPEVWFSTNPYWEKTVNKLEYSSGGTYRQLSFSEMKKIGIARIEVEPIESIVPFGKYFSQCNMKKRTFNSLIKSGREMGANPKQWLASLLPITQSNWANIQIMQEGVWVDFNNLK